MKWLYISAIKIPRILNQISDLFKRKRILSYKYGVLKQFDLNKKAESIFKKEMIVKFKTAHQLQKYDTLCMIFVFNL